jgi:hypothetical protein
MGHSVRILCMVRAEKGAAVRIFCKPLSAKHF